MRNCNACRSSVPDESETCPQCGNLVPRGILASLFGLFKGKPAPPAISAAQTSGARKATGAFSMKVEDVFSISGRGTVVTGQIGSGEVRIADEVRFVSTKGVSVKSNVSGIEMLRKVVDVAKTGDTVGLLLRGVKQEDVSIGTTIESA